ncbi:MAG: hypothetical protein AB1782_17065, partial [Cyanobacteriota bacterium]
FIGVCIIAFINTFVVASLVIGVFFTIDSASRSDLFAALPIKEKGFVVSTGLLNHYFVFIENHFLISLIIGFVLIISSLVVFMLFFKGYIFTNKSLLIAVFVVLTLPTLFFTIRETGYFTYYFQQYLFDYNRYELFKALFLVFWYPSIGILLLSYIVLSDYNTMVKFVISVLLSVFLAHSSNSFMNETINIAKIRDFNAEFSDIDGLITGNDIENKYFSFIFSMNNSESISYKAQLSGIQASKENWKIVKNYLLKHPDTFLKEYIYLFALYYYLQNESIKEYRNFLLTQYLNDNSSFNSFKLVYSIYNESNLSDKYEKLSLAYENNDNYISKISYGFMAAIFTKMKLSGEAEKFWKKYDLAKPETYHNEVLMPIIEVLQKDKTNSVNIRGRLMLLKKPFENKTIMFFDRDEGISLSKYFDKYKANIKEKFVSNVYSTCNTDNGGYFNCELWTIKPVVLMLDGNYGVLGADKDLEILAKIKPGEYIDLGTVILIKQ